MNQTASNSSIASTEPIMTQPQLPAVASTSTAAVGASASTSNAAATATVAAATDVQTQGGCCNPFVKQVNKYFTPPVQLQDWKDMPRHLQFNPYVLKGYRPLQDVKGCFNSLFYLHNETINILSHGTFFSFFFFKFDLKLRFSLV